MKSYPVKFGKMMHVFPNKCTQNEGTNIRVFEGKDSLSLCFSVGHRRINHLTYTLTLKNNKVYLYAIYRDYTDKTNKKLIIRRENLCTTYRLNRVIRVACKDSFNPYENPSINFTFKAIGVYRSLVKLFYEKCKDFIDLPKVNFNKTEFGEVIKLAAFPAIKEMYIYHKKLPKYIPELLSPVFRKAKTISDVIKGIYTKHYKKGYKYLKLAIDKEETENEIWGKIILHYILRGLLPFDYIVDIMEHSNPELEMKMYLLGKAGRGEYRDARNFLKQFNPIQLYSLLKTGTSHELRDTIYMWKEYNNRIPLPKIYNLHDLHEYYSREGDKLKHKDFQLANLPKALELDGIRLDGMTLYIPKTNHELLSWGRQMHNCIGSYGMRVGKEGRIILGILKEGKLTYNIEIYGGRINQFYASKNRPPPEKDYDMVKNYLTEKKIVL